MKINYKAIVFTAAALVFAGCQKFVDIKTQGNLVPNQTINYRYLLNNTSGFETNPNLFDFASDDINITDATQVASLSGSSFYYYYVASYTWQPVFYVAGGTNENDLNWNASYAVILNCNTIINELPASDGTAQEKEALIAEAKVHRADAYLTLVNAYAKPYNATTASTDLGLPLLTTQTVSQSLKRASVQQIYNQVIDDLTSAIPALPNTQAYNTLPSKASAYSEVARCYLYMNNYAEANRYADLALSLRSTLNDLAVYTPTSTNYPRRIADPEVILSKITNGGTMAYQGTAFKLSDELLTLLGTTDQRYQLFTVPGTTIATSYTGRFFYKERFVGETRNVGPSVPEMMLIKAEYYARNNDATNAMLWVNRLREKRFKAADYVPMTASSPADALAKVIEERRREFFGRMLRWWDMRRLKNEPAFQKTYTRVFNGTTYTLAPNSNRYVFPIAQSLINLNPELEPNP
ncbi:RagB/SusD family nutrient uptake outer membrane protein [Pedobacter sp. SL55]|uniref:RagB/SusD family nutrient uptake outer membrane protein n=1 Tax=Pedobacter sp. SL55 TaxID=2995161 RepID=UPI00226E7B75|nr:RagB/SusD family nutrient uptake outer membrane protein [Pedobacter sp. SL55]WAC40053.1 RagB/SusD family nutrient uptake outer membrane protein [Pedobacter sp. SL55]